jgi:DNA-binding transcriptional MerR regulator
MAERRTLEIETKLLSTEALCRVLGVPVHVLRTWIERHGLVRFKQAGSGRRYSFSIQDVFVAAAVKALVDAGVSPRHAIAALDLQLYGSYLRGEEPLILAQRPDGHWSANGIPCDPRQIPVSIGIGLSALWSSIRERLAKEVGAHVVSEFESRVPDCRAEAERNRRRAQHQNDRRRVERDEMKRRRASGELGHEA